MDTSIFHELGLLDCAVLKRDAESKFEVLYQSQDWLSILLPESNNAKSFSIGDNSLYLQDFMTDAESLWHSKEAGKEDSGIWTETISDHTYRLEAQAIASNNNQYLVIHRIQDKFEKQQRTLQLARELLISNDKINEKHETLHAQMAELLDQTELAKKVDLPIIQALEQTDLGVAILDNQLQLIRGNPALKTLFNDSHIEIKQPIDRLILDLFKRQYPEFERICQTNSPWSGEICWLNPPEQGKWLKLTLRPTVNHEHQLQYWILSVSDVTQVKFLLKRNEKLTHFDVLTDLPNRQYFWQQLEDKIHKNRPFYLLYIDIKHFKKINDVHGHLVGDKLIKDLSKRLHSVTKMEDVIARIGGTEFAILMDIDNVHSQLSYNGRNQCQELAEELIRTSNHPFYLESGHKCEVGLNIGAAAYPIDSNTAEELMKFADLAVFSAKKHDKSNLEFYSQKLVNASLRRIEMEQALQDAIVNKQFELFLQPIIDLKTGKVIKAETLIRWRLDNGDLVLPNEFIPLAEQTGLIIPIGKWVIKEALLLLAQLKQRTTEIKLTVNLSPRQIADRQLLDFIKTQLYKSEVSAELLELELTEGVLIENYEKVQFLLTELRNLGISVSIDDFGTGYSSLSYLQKLPIDNIKIDRSFTMSLNEEGHVQNGNGAIILAVLAMAKSLDLSVIAEGVETRFQKEFLMENQCHTAQGYLFSRPLPYKEFCALLDAEKH